jgi:hypothetical protein
MPQLKYWNGSAWVVPKAVKTWDGSQWVDRSGRAKYWDGSQWVRIKTSNYLIKDGLLQNGYTVDVYSKDDDSYYGYSNGSKSLFLSTYTGGYISLRSVQNIDLTHYTTMYATMSMGWGDTGGYGIIYASNPHPNTPGGAFARIERYHYEGTAPITRTVSLASLSGNYSIMLGASANSDGSIDFYIHDLWFE